MPALATISAEMAADADEDGGIEFFEDRAIFNRFGDEHRQELALSRDRRVSIRVSQKEPRSPQPVGQIFKRRIKFASRGFIGRIQSETTGNFLPAAEQVILEIRKGAM